MIARLNGSRSAQDALNNIVDIETVTFLVAVTKHRDWLIQHGASHEDRKKSLEVVAKSLSRSVHVRESQHDGAHSVTLVVEEMQLLGRQVVGTAERDVARPADRGEAEPEARHDEPSRPEWKNRDHDPGRRRRSTTRLRALLAAVASPSDT